MYHHITVHQTSIKECAAGANNLCRDVQVGQCYKVTAHSPFFNIHTYLSYVPLVVSKKHKLKPPLMCTRKPSAVKMFRTSSTRGVGQDHMRQNLLTQHFVNAWHLQPNFEWR